MSRKINNEFVNQNTTHVEIPLVFQRYMDNLDEPCGIKDKSSIFVYANKAYHDLLNLPKGYNVAGRLDSKLPATTSEYASMFQAHDRLVENTGKRRSSLEIHPFGRDQKLRAYFLIKRLSLIRLEKPLGLFSMDAKRNIYPCAFIQKGIRLNHYYLHSQVISSQK